MTYDCKEFKSSLIKQIVLLYDFILMYFEVNAEYEVRIPLYELPEKYRYDNFFGATRKIEILIREVQTDLDLWHLGIVREEMKIWKKLWEKWGGRYQIYTLGETILFALPKPGHVGITERGERVDG